MATKRDSSNLQLFLDLAALSAQTRNFATYRECYQKLVNKLSGRENFWIGLIVGYFLEENYTKCLEAIDAYRGSLKEGASYTRQELLFLEVDCYLRQNESIKAITTLEKGMSDVLNELQAKEKLATLLGKAGTFEVDGVSRDGIEESRKLWTDLFERTRLSLVLTRQPNELSVPARTGVLRAARLRVVRSLDAAAASQHVARPFAGANAASPRLPRRSLREAADLSAAPLRAVALARRGGIRSAVQRDDR